MENIFDGAKFGDKFLTRNEKIAIYHKKTPYNKHYLMVEDLLEFVPYDKAGICLGDDEWNIVSKYQEPIDEEIMNNYINSLVDNVVEANSTEMRKCNSFCIDDVKELMKRSYKKAKEE